MAIKSQKDYYFGTEGVSHIYKRRVADYQTLQAWLAYFWRRAKNHGLEPDIADEHLAYWINHDTEEHATSQDAVDGTTSLLVFACSLVKTSSAVHVTIILRC